MMKKIFLLVICFVMFKIGYAQYPIQQFIGADSAVVTSKGGLQGRLINQVFADTTAANSQRIRQYPGAMIYASGKLWVRNSTATSWGELAYGGAGSLSGAGTTNYVTKWTNSNTLGNSQIFDNGTKVGIGTNNPISFLDIVKNQNEATRVSVKNSTPGNLSQTGIDFQNDGFSSLSKYSALYPPIFNVLSGGDYVLYNTTNGDISVWNNFSTGKIKFTTGGATSPQMTLSSAGNLGIGNNVTADSNLMVQGGAHLQRGVRMSGLPTGAGTKQLRIDANGVLSIADTTSSLSGYVPYVGATQNVNLGQFGLKTEYVEFDTTLRAPADRTLSWNNNDGTLNLGMTNGGSITQKVGLQQFARVKNVDNVQINKGQAVYIFGASGDRASVKRAFNKADSASSKVLGVAAENIPVNDVGLVGTFGTISNLNLAAFNPGDILYLDSVPGQLTATKPQAPYHLVFVGVVERANAGNGLLFVNPQNGYELEELHNVRITSPVPNNAILSYDSVAKLWKDTTLNGIGGVTGSGTTNYIPKFTSSSAIGNSSIIENTFSIVSSKDIGVKDAGSSSNFNVSNYSVGAQLGAFDGGGYGRVGTYTNHDFIFMTNTTERMRLNASGNLGLGTSSPSYKVTTDGNGNAFMYAALSGSIGTVGNWVGYLYGYTGNTYQKGATIFESIDANGRGKFHIALNNDANSTNVSLSDARLTVLPSGNVGIGTTSPTPYTAGALVFNQLSSNANSEIKLTNSTTGNAAGAGLLLAQYGVNSYLLNASSGVLVFGTSDAERMRLDASGNLIVGMTYPLLNAANRGNITLNGTTDAVLTFGNNLTASGYIYSSSNKLELDAQGSRWMQFNTNGSERMRLDASGNLGLGTSSPAYKLHTVGQIYASNDATSTIIANRSAYSATTGFALSSQTSTRFTWNLAASTDDSRISDASGNTILYIAQSGNLGLGVTPSAWSNFTGLQVGETGSFASNDFGSGNIQTFIGNNVYYDAVGFKYIQAGSARMLRMTSDAFNWEIAGTGSANAAISFTQAMTLDASGRLGIGTTLPTYKLDLYDAVNSAYLNVTAGTTSMLFGSAVAGLGILGTTSNHELDIRTNNTSAIRITTSGNVGIGTTSPSNALEIGASGNIKLKGGAVSFDNPNNTRTFNIASNNDNALIFTDLSASTERMRITSGGNVGIGNTNPNSYYSGANNLVVGNTSASNGMTIASINSGFGAFYFADGTSGSELYRGFIEYGHTNDYMSFGAAGSERMRITSGGSVGIGTTSPLDKLNVAGSGNFGITISNSGNTGSDYNALRFYHASNEKAVIFTNSDNLSLSTASGFLSLQTSSSERMRITSGGNVGIGTTNPQALLELYGSAPDLRLNRSTNGAMTIDFAITGSQIGFISSNSSSGEQRYAIGPSGGWGGFHTFYTDASERMRITSGGELLINTTSDAGDYKLQVNGNTYVSGSLLTMSVGDIWIQSGGQGILSPNASRLITIQNGAVEIGGTIKTAAPSGGTAAAWKLGSKVSATVSLVTTDYIEVEIGGVAYKLAIVN